MSINEVNEMNELPPKLRQTESRYHDRDIPDNSTSGLSTTSPGTYGTFPSDKSNGHKACSTVTCDKQGEFYHNEQKVSIKKTFHTFDRIFILNVFAI